MRGLGEVGGKVESWKGGKLERWSGGKLESGDIPAKQVCPHTENVVNLVILPKGLSNKYKNKRRGF